LLAERVAPESATPPSETSPDLVAARWRGGTWSAERFDYWKARELKDSPVATTRSFTYLYCLNGSVEKAKTLAAAAGSTS